MSVRDLIPWGRSRALRSGEDVHPAIALHREVNRLFDEFARSFDAPWFGPPAWPRVDVREDADSVEVTAELPGLTEKDVEVRVAGDALIIEGERKSERDREQNGHVLSERFFGRFHRTIPLDVEIDDARASATMKNGVLTVTLPKSAAAKERTKRIPVNGK